MDNRGIRKKIGWIVSILLLVGMVQGAMAAQSSAAGPADDNLKGKLRTEIVGQTAFPGEDKEYVIGHGDVLAVNVYGEGNMAAASGSVPVAEDVQQPGRENRGSTAGGAVVRMDGRVSLLHVGDVNVLGMTLAQATDYLTKLYATVYSKPMVTVVLLQSNSRRYTIMGQIRTPGVYNIDYPITVVQSIARSGGFTEWAKHDITVVRAGDGVKTSQGADGKATIKFDYDDVVKGRNLEKNVYLQSGDIVIVH